MVVDVVAEAQPGRFRPWRAHEPRLARRVAAVCAALVATCCWIVVGAPVEAGAPVGLVSNFTGPGIAAPSGIGAGPDGNLWFTNYSGNSIGRVTPAGVVSNFANSGVVSPMGIAAGPEGSMWFTNSVSTGSIGRVNAVGTFSFFPPSSALQFPQEIAAGPDGNMWVTSAGSVARITSTGAITPFTGGGISSPIGIAAGPDGNMWFTNSGGHSIGRITPAGAVTSFGGPLTGVTSAPFDIAAGPDGNMWFTSNSGHSIGRITPTGVLTKFTDPGISSPTGIALGNDGNMWFTNHSGSSVGRITPTGVISIFPGTGINGPFGVAAGPDGNLWFTNRVGNSIGSIGVGPGVPRAVTATTGDASATVSWTPPAFDAASPVTGYTVTASPGGQTCSWAGGPFSCIVTGLSNGSIYTFTVTASYPNGPGPPSWPTNAVAITPPLAFHPLNSARILDSRPPPNQVGPYGTPWGPAQSRDVNVTGVGGVAAGAPAVVANVTVTGTSGAGYLTIWPAGQPRPVTSSLNWSPGQTIANSVTVKTGAGGLISVFNAVGDAYVIIDVVGYYDQAAGDGYTSLTPARILDTRPPPNQVGAYSNAWPANTTRYVTVTGAVGVPAGADAVVMNITVTGTTAAGYLTIWPGGPRPMASSLNWSPGQTIANLVTVKAGSYGHVAVFNAVGSTHVIIDVVGYFAAGSGQPFHSWTPTRIQDSRPPPNQVGPYGTPWATNEVRDVQVPGLVPASAGAALLNVTATGTTAAGHLTIWPAGQPPPLVSSLNWAAGETLSNAVVSKLGANRAISVKNAPGTAHVIGDLGGWYA